MTEPLGLDEAHRLLEALYNTLPRLECRKLCWTSCGVIAMSRLEFERWRAAVPADWPGWPDPRTDPLWLRHCTCPLLTDDHLCGAYDRRPLVCRLYGLVEDMPCPWGCRPERVLTSTEGRALMQAVESIAQAANMGMPEALRRALTGH